jgi:Tfp pilus assembly protein PilF
MTAAQRNHGRLVRLAIAGSLLAIVAAVAAWAWWPRATEPGPPAASDDPRVRYAGPFLNVRPEVKYVGDTVCAECHADLAAVYARHPMGQAMAEVSRATPLEKYGAAAHNPFSAGPLRYEVRRDGGRVFHGECWSRPDDPATRIEAEVHFAMGSGAKARSYMISRDGYLFQSPITWFVAAQRWDLSPSYEIRNWHFTRNVSPGCLFCHCNYADHIPGSLNRYREPIFHGLGIGCERCHGPGELHVAARREEKLPEGAADYTIVNPARLEHHLREAVCQQCHIQGEERVVARGRSDWDFRPGLPLHEFLMDFVDAKDARGGQKFVSSVEQMMASRCYKESREPKKMGCTTCHDPHRVPENETAKVTHYRARCLTCHTDQSCTVPEPARRSQRADDSCVACHMPQTGSEVNHSSITNHQIPRIAPKRRTPERPPTPGPFDLVPFHRHLVAMDDPEVQRNLGMARMQMLNRGMPRAMEREFAAAALPLLEEAARRHPADWPAIEARSDALWLLGQLEESHKGYAAAVAANPDRERSRIGAGQLALDMNRVVEARDHLEHLVKLNPWHSQYQHELARACFRMGDWTRAAEACRRALKLEPFQSSTRSLLTQTLLWDGRAAEAQAEFDQFRRLTPVENHADVDRWYREEKARAAGR